MSRKASEVRTAFKIFLRDLKRIATNPVAVVIAVGVCIIPSVYAWMNILANWDPYESTSTVPIAVVVEDAGAVVSEDMGYLNAGDMVRERLEENDQLGWTFVDSEDEAIEGVKAGSYYAAFVIPEDFTSSLADVLDGDTDQAHIAYYVNEKANAISPKVTDTGSTTIENQIATEFVNVVGQTVTERLQGVAGDAVTALDEATATAADDLGEAADKVGSLASELEGAESVIDQARESVAVGRSTLAQLTGTATSLQDALANANATLGGTREQAQSLTAELSQALGTGISTASSISGTAAYDIGQITGDVGWATGKLDAAIAQVRASNGTVQTLRASLERTRQTIVELQLGNVSAEFDSEITRELDAEIAYLVELSDYQLGMLDELEALSTKVKETNSTVENLSDSVNSAIQETTQGLSELQGELASTTLPGLSNALDSFGSAAGQLTGTAQSLAPMLEQADSTLAQLDSILAQSKESVSKTASSLEEAASKLDGLAQDVAALQSAATLDGIEDVLGLDAEQVGDFMSTPAEMVSEAVYPVENYGSGVTPFYTNLALWVGGFVLVAIYKLEVDDEGIGDFKPWQGFFGRWLLLNLLGQVQAVVCCVGDIMLGIQCLYPAAFVFAGMVESFVYVFFIYAISVAFKHIGKALGVLLVILQIPGASGTYPIEMMPGFFQALHPWLPFTYGINAMREAIAGFYGNYYIENLLVLLVFLIPALLIGVSARRHLLNVNSLFDKRLGETDLMITEHVEANGGRFKLATIVKVIMGSEEYAAVFSERATKFELMYPTLVRRGLAALIWVPLVLLALLFVTSAKYLCLNLWILSLVVTCAFLIVVEYLHTRVAEKTALSRMSREELYDLLNDELREEFMAFAPIDKIVLEHGGPEQAANDAREAALDALGHVGARMTTATQRAAAAAAEATAELGARLPKRDEKGGDDE